MITCPVANVPAWTGFRSVRGSSLETLRQIRLKPCPECGNGHLWDGKDAYWKEPVAEPPRRYGFRLLPAKAGPERDR